MSMQNNRRISMCNGSHVTKCVCRMLIGFSKSPFKAPPAFLKKTQDPTPPQKAPPPPKQTAPQPQEANLKSTKSRLQPTKMEAESAEHARDTEEQADQLQLQQEACVEEFRTGKKLAWQNSRPSFVSLKML